MSRLVTQRMVLRPTRAQDRLRLHALEQDPEVMRYLNGGVPTPLDVSGSTHDFLTPRGGEAGVWAAIEGGTGTFLGWFSLQEEDGAATLGYRLARPFWGQGFATEGARALVDHGFRNREYERIVATTMAVNQASRRVMEKAGLRYIRTVHFDWPHPLPGAEQGDVEYCLLRREWAAGQASQGSG